MTIVEYTMNMNGKCGSCSYYGKGNKKVGTILVCQEWLNGYCSNPHSKVRDKNRYYNSKACVQYQRKKSPDGEV